MKVAKEYRGIKIKMMADISSKTLKIRRKWNYTFKGLNK